MFAMIPGKAPFIIQHLQEAMVGGWAGSPLPLRIPHPHVMSASPVPAHHSGFSSSVSYNLSSGS